MRHVRALLVPPNAPHQVMTIETDSAGSLLPGFQDVMQTGSLDLLVVTDDVDLWLDRNWRHGTNLNIPVMATLQALANLNMMRSPVYGPALFTGPPDDNHETQSLADTPLALIHQVLDVATAHLGGPWAPGAGQ